MSAQVPLRLPGHPDAERESGVGLYVHIPFCETKCPYCDFNTYSCIESLIPAYVDALCAELTRWGSLVGRLDISTVFFGGGTPSYVPGADIARVVGTYRAAFNVAPTAETTLESNPGDVTAKKLAAWREAGINRLSIGVQSFDDTLLKMLGRRHTASEAEAAFLASRAGGFDNVSLDLMFGLPRQTLTQWQSTLERTIALGPEHISAYGLQLEHGTPLESDVRRGVMPAPDDDLAADMYVLADELLAGAGYSQYEVSNWAKPGRPSRHNLSYWHCAPYLGVGPGAHSSLHGLRFSNMRSPKLYIAAAQNDAPPAGANTGQDAIRLMREHGPVDFVEVTTPNLAIAETLMMGLRLNSGLDFESFRARHGHSVVDLFSPEMSELSKSGLLQIKGSSLSLTPKGRLLGNEVFRKFVEAAERLDLGSFNAAKSRRGS